MILRSLPEELTNISLVDPLNRFEAKLGSVQELLDRAVAENINMKDRLDHIASYASVLKRGEPVERQKLNSHVAAVLTADRASRSSVYLDKQHMDYVAHEIHRLGRDLSEENQIAF